MEISPYLFYWGRYSSRVQFEDPLTHFGHLYANQGFCYSVEERGAPSTTLDTGITRFAEHLRLDLRLAESLWERRSTKLFMSLIVYNQCLSFEECQSG